MASLSTAPARWVALGLACAAGVAQLSGCIFVLEFPAPAGEGGGAAQTCEPLAVEECVADPAVDAAACDDATRTCLQDGSAFGPCGCAGLIWADSFGSATGSAQGTSVAVAESGDVVVAGLFSGAVNFGGSTLTAAGERDMFLASFSATGEHLWSQRFGNSQDQTAPPKIAVDSGGSVVMVGAFTGALSLGGEDLTAANVFGNVFVAKFDAGGAHQWSNAFGERCVATSVAIGSNDSIAVAGAYRDALSFGPGASLLNLSETADTFIARLDADGSALWATAHGTSDHEDTGLFVAVGADDVTVVAGIYAGDLIGSDLVMLSSATPVVYAFSYEHDEINDDLIVRWATQLEGTGTQELSGIAIDAGGEVVVVGSFKGSLTAGALSPLQTVDATEDAFVVRLAGDTGDASWSQAWSDSGDTRPRSVRVDASGDIVIAGSMNGAADFGGGSLPLAEGATDAAWLVKLTSAGEHTWSKALSSANAQLLFADVATDPTSEELCVTGNLVGELDLGLGVITATDDVLVARFAP